MDTYGYRMNVTRDSNTMWRWQIVRSDGLVCRFGYELSYALAEAEAQGILRTYTGE